MTTVGHNLHWQSLETEIAQQPKPFSGRGCAQHEHHSTFLSLLLAVESTAQPGSFETGTDTQERV